MGYEGMIKDRLESLKKYVYLEVNRLKDRVGESLSHGEEKRHADKSFPGYSVSGSTYNLFKHKRAFKNEKTIMHPRKYSRSR